MEDQHICLIVLLKENIVSGRRELSAFGENPVLVTLWQKEITHWKVMPREISVFDKGITTAKVCLLLYTKYLGDTSYC